MLSLAPGSLGGSGSEGLLEEVNLKKRNLSIEVSNLAQLNIKGGGSSSQIVIPVN